MDDRTYSKAIARAEKLGAAAGKQAGNSYFDGNTPRETYEIVLKGIDDGDPAVLDQLPSCILTDEDAAEVYEDIVTDINREDSESVEENDLIEIYADAFNLAATREAERVARYQLGD